MADKMDQIKIDGKSYDIDLPVDAKPVISSLIVTNTSSNRSWTVSSGVVAADSLINNAFYSNDVNAKRFTITTTPTLYSNGSIPTLSESYTNITIEPYTGADGHGGADTFSVYIPSKDTTITNLEAAKSTFAYQGWVNTRFDNEVGDNITLSYDSGSKTLYINRKAKI